MDDDREEFIQNLEEQEAADRSSAAQAAEMMPLPPLAAPESGAKSLAIIRKYLEDVSVIFCIHLCETMCIFVFIPAYVSFVF